MAKAGSTSWVTALKKALSPTKDSPNKARSTASEDHGIKHKRKQHEKTDKRRWIVRKLTARNHQCCDTNVATTNRKHSEATSADIPKRPSLVQQHTVSSNSTLTNAYLTAEQYAATIIQTAFRGYLARRALQGLQGIVKLQALVRGYNIRTQAKTSLQRMQAMTQVQAKMRDQCSRISSGEIRKSMYAETNNLWDRYKDIQQRKPKSTDGNSIADQWELLTYTLEDIETLLQSKEKPASYREGDIAYASSQKIWRTDRNHGRKDQKQEVKNSEWLNQWMDSKQSGINDNGLLTHRFDSIKTIDVESLPAHLREPAKNKRSQDQDKEKRRHSLHLGSPINTAHNISSCQSYVTPYLTNSRPIQVRSASPQYCRSHSTTSTPNLRSRCPSTVNSYRKRTGATTVTPNYMAATESAKARARTQSTPRQRSSIPERQQGGSVKKRLSYPSPIPETEYSRSTYMDHSCISKDLKTPSFRSVQGDMYRVERGFVCSYTDGTGGEHSPASTSHIRRWLS